MLLHPAVSNWTCLRNWLHNYGKCSIFGIWWQFSSVFVQPLYQFWSYGNSEIWRWNRIKVGTMCVYITSWSEVNWQLRIYLLSLQVVLATGPGNPPAVRVLTGGSVRFGSVRFVTRPKTRPALSWRVCYPDRTYTRGVLAGLYPDRGSISRFLQISSKFRSN